MNVRNFFFLVKSHQKATPNRVSKSANAQSCKYPVCLFSKRSMIFVLCSCNKTREIINVSRKTRKSKFLANKTFTKKILNLLCLAPCAGGCVSSRSWCSRTSGQAMVSPHNRLRSRARPSNRPPRPVAHPLRPAPRISVKCSADGIAPKRLRRRLH